MKTLKIIAYIGFMVLCSNIYAQEYSIDTRNTISNPLKKDLVIDVSTVEYYTYTIDVLTLETNAVSFGINIRFEDELDSETNYRPLQDISFLDFNINYTVGNFDMFLQLENILNYNDDNFAIEPNLTDNNTIVFSHEANVLLTASIVYNF